MPEAAFLIDQKIKGGMRQIRNIGGRHNLSGAERNLASGPQLRQRALNEVVNIPWTEEGAGPDNQRIGVMGRDPRLRLGLAPAIGANRTGRVGLDIRPAA